MREKMSKQPPPAPTASAVGPCPTVIQSVGRPALEDYPGPSHHPTTPIFTDDRFHTVPPQSAWGWLVGWLFWV